MPQPPTFSLSRIIIFGHRVNALKLFYVHHFGFSVVEEIKDQWIVLKAGAVELALHKIGPGYEPENGKEFREESNTKLVFLISHDLSAFRQKLADNGVSIGEVKSFEGIDSLFCDGEDPEGNVFQLEQKVR